MVLPLITLPYLVRVLGLEKYGMIAFSGALVIYFSAAIQYGFNVTAVRDIARSKEDSSTVNKIFNLAVTISFLIFCAAFIMLNFVILSFEIFYRDYYLYLFSFLFSSAQFLFPVWFFQGLGKMKYIAFINILCKVAAVISILFFIKKEDDYLLVPLINLLWAMAALLFSFWLVFTKFSLCYRFPNFEDLKLYMKKGGAAFISQMAPMLYNNSSIFLLGLFAPATVVGIYTAASRVVDVFCSLATILSSTFLPYLAKQHVAIPKFNNGMLIAGCILTVLCILLSDFSVALLFSDKNQIISFYIAMLSPSIIAFFAMYCFGTNSLMLMGYDILVKNIALYTSLLFSIVALCLIPLFGIIGSCITIIGARLVMALCYGYFYKKYYKNGVSVEGVN